MSIDLQESYIDKAALVIMHYQVDVFDILFGDQHHRRRSFKRRLG
jgi:hypothetical protein